MLVAGLLLGAGLPALFACGVRLLAGSAGAVGARRIVGRFGAYLVFVVVIAVVLIGLIYIVASGFGKTLSFEHIFPVLVDK